VTAALNTPGGAVIGQTQPRVQVAADEDVPVVEVDGRVAVAGGQPDLVAKP
jgi:hypothetical protein